jgi:ATP-dependent Clp protease protease subunit
MDEVDDESVKPLVLSILEYNLMDEQDQPDHLTLFINTVGGSANSCYHLIDMIKQSPIPVHTIGNGCVASAGVLLLMAGEKGHRYVSETCSIMSHQYSGGMVGKEHELRAAAKDMEIESERMMLHYRKCTKKTENYIRKHLLQQSDCYLTPAEAVLHGICDEVLPTYK